MISGYISTLMVCLPSSRPACAVFMLPPKGSKTTSPFFKQNRIMSLISPASMDISMNRLLYLSVSLGSAGRKLKKWPPGLRIRCNSDNKSSSTSLVWKPMFFFVQVPFPRRTSLIMLVKTRITAVRDNGVKIGKEEKLKHVDKKIETISVKLYK